MCRAASGTRAAKATAVTRLSAWPLDPDPGEHPLANYRRHFLHGMESVTGSKVTLFRRRILHEAVRHANLRCAPSGAVISGCCARRAYLTPCAPSPGNTKPRRQRCEPGLRPDARRIARTSASTADRIAGADRSISSAVIDQFEIEMRSPSAVPLVLPDQHVPSACRRVTSRPARSPVGPSLVACTRRTLCRILETPPRPM
jgi:hypothetical protein